MLIIDRRTLLKKMAALAAVGLVPGAKALSPVIADPTKDPQHISKTFLSLYTWYNKNFYDFEKVLTSNEKAYLKACLESADDWGHQINDQFSYSLFSHSHRVKNGKVNHSRMAVGSFKKQKEFLPLVKAIFKERGIDPQQIPDFEKTIGLGWDMEAGHFKVYLFSPKDNSYRDKDLDKLRLKTKEEAFGVNLISYTIQGNKIIEKKVYVPTKEALVSHVNSLPFKEAIKHTNLMITDQRGVVPQVDIGDEMPVAQHFSKQGREIVALYGNEINWEVDTITYNTRDDYTIYF